MVKLVVAIGFFFLPENKCFGLFGKDSPLNWTDAQTQCRSYGVGYDLASILTANEQGELCLLPSMFKAHDWLIYVLLTFCS